MSSETARAVSGMSDAETVPDWLRPHIEALRDAVAISGHVGSCDCFYCRLRVTARALVDAVEQSTAGCDVCRSVTVGLPGWKCGNCGAEVTQRPADPVSEARCRCGHERRDHRISDGYCGANACCGTEKCDDTFTPVPPPTTLSDEA